VILSGPVAALQYRPFYLRFSEKKPPALPVVTLSLALALSKNLQCYIRSRFANHIYKAKEVVHWTKINYHIQFGNVNII